MALVKPLHSGDPDVLRNSQAATCIWSDLHAYSTRNRITFSHDPPSPLEGEHKWDPEWQLITAVTEYSPAVQEVPGSVPDWDTDALCKVCRWLRSSLYNENENFGNFPFDSPIIKSDDLPCSDNLSELPSSGNYRPLLYNVCTRKCSLMGADTCTGIVCTSVQ